MSLSELDKKNLDNRFDRDRRKINLIGTWHQVIWEHIS